jgi:DNA-binding PucR family transcriptional regulator
LRTETVRAILSGEVLDGDGASRVLGYELRRHHVGLVLWAQPVDGEETALAKLESAAAETAGAIGCPQPLVVGVGRARVWAWAGTHGPPVTTISDAVECARLDGISIGIGDPALGVEGFRRTHRDAEDAARVAMLARRRRGAVTLYRSVQVAAQMAGEIERTRRFVADQLGPLASMDDAAVRLRATLEIYLEESGSRLHAARRLGIHQNTVANRVKACRELLGRDLDKHGVELQVALMLAHTLGPGFITVALFSH